MKVAGHGAEAKVFETEYLGRDAILKVRPVKKYRHPDLDWHLRSSRTKNEVRIIREARSAGVRTPVIYDVDLKECSITMEHIKGRCVKEILDTEPAGADDICRTIGKTLAELHKSKICHGDLTTSNMIITQSGELCLIDLSLGNTSIELEDMGVDIHLLKRAFTSAHSGLDDSFNVLLESYKKNMPDSASVMRRVEDIRERGRYT